MKIMELLTTLFKENRGKEIEDLLKLEIETNGSLWETESLAICEQDIKQALT